MLQEFVTSENNCNFDKELEIAKMKKLPEFKEQELGGNPFAQKLEIPVTEIVSDVDYEADEEGVIINKKIYAEKTRKVELYIHENANNNVANLSDKAQRLYLFLLYSVNRGKDFLQINSEYYMKLNRIKSFTTYSNAVKELVRYEYIVKSCVNSVYWINPYRFFPGSRLIKYSDKKKIVQEWDKTKS